MKFNLNRFATLAVVSVLAASSFGQLTTYTQDFEGLSASSPTALSGNGWKVFANVFSSGGGYLYGYGPFGAPNGGGGFSAIATGEAGPAQGSQYINTYNDYNNTGEHNNGNFVEANIFQEQIIGAGDLGKTFDFDFDFKASSTAGPAGQTTANAFIKVLTPNTFNLVAFPNQSTTAASTANWLDGKVSITIDSSWTGHILQFGFLNKATSFQNSGVFYDNLSFQAVPEPATMSMLFAGLAGVALRRRKK